MVWQVRVGGYCDGRDFGSFSERDVMGLCLAMAVGLMVARAQ